MGNNPGKIADHAEVILKQDSSILTILTDFIRKTINRGDEDASDVNRTIARVILALASEAHSISEPQEPIS